MGKNDSHSSTISGSPPPSGWASRYSCASAAFTGCQPSGHCVMAETVVHLGVSASQDGVAGFEQRTGSADEKPLPEVNAEGSQLVKGLLVFDTFGDGRLAERPGHLDDCLHHVRIGFVLCDAVDESPVDLHVGDGE